MDSSPEVIRSAVDGSLRRLGAEADCINLYCKHRIDLKVEPEEVDRRNQK